MKTINHLIDILVTMNTLANREKLFKSIKLLYRLAVFDIAKPMKQSPPF